MVERHKVDPAFSVDARIAAFLMIIAAMCYSGSVVVARGVHESIPPMTLVFWRCTLSSLLLAPFVGRALWDAWPHLKKNWGLMIALAVTQSIAGQGLLYLGLDSTTATNAGLINTTLPFLAVLFAALFAGERVSRLQVGGMVTAGVGVIAVVAKGDLSALGQLKIEPGDIWVQLAMVSWGIYAILVKRMSAELGILVAYLAMTIVGALIALPLFLIEHFVLGDIATPSWASVGAIVYIATFGSIVALMFWNIGIKTLGAGTATNFVLLQTVLTAVLAVVFLGEVLTSYHVRGGALVVIGVFFATRSATTSG